jgi:pimeloyl-ACP methyl ester carboxylesterase
MIHGFGEGAYVWDHFAPHLSKKYRVFAVDLRGHGRSGWDSSGRYALETYLADVMHVVGELKLERFSLVGHSLGADVAIRMAAQWPGRVEAMVLVDYGLNTNALASEHIRAGFRAQFRPYRSTAEYAQQLQLSRPMASPAVLEYIAGQAMRRREDGGYELRCDPALAELEGMPKDTKLADLLGSITCPSLIVRGIGSAMLPKQSAEHTLTLLRNGRLKIVPASGHAVMSDNPAGFATAVYPFLCESEDWPGASAIKATP